MNFYLKKTIMGYKICDEEEAEYKAWNLEDAKLLLDTYNKTPSLKDKIKSLTKEKEDLEQEYSKLNTKYNDLVKKFNSIKEMYGSLETKYNFLEDREEKTKKFNENLLQISRERANAQRNLRPRRLYHGYVIKKSNTRYFFKTIKAPDPLNYMKTIQKTICTEIFDYTLETPYNSNLLRTNIEKAIIKDFESLFNFSFLKSMSFKNVPNTEKVFRITSLGTDDSDFYKLKIQTNKELDEQITFQK